MPPAHHDGPEAAPPRGSGRGGPRVAVVVPTYNEAGNLPVLARRLFALDIPECVLIVVDDGSPDGTGDVALMLQAEYDGRVELIQRGSKQGLGTAYLDGLAHALDTGADHIVHMDADLSHAPEYIPGFLGDLDDADVVVGSRYVEGGGSEEEWGLRRRILSMIANTGHTRRHGHPDQGRYVGFQGVPQGSPGVAGHERVPVQGIRLSPGGDQRVPAAGLPGGRAPHRLRPEGQRRVEAERGHSPRSVVEAAAAEIHEAAWKGWPRTVTQAGAASSLRPSPHLAGRRSSRRRAGRFGEELEDGLRLHHAVHVEDGQSSLTRDPAAVLVLRGEGHVPAPQGASP